MYLHIVKDIPLNNQLHIGEDIAFLVAPIGHPRVFHDLWGSPRKLLNSNKYFVPDFDDICGTSIFAMAHIGLRSLQTLLLFS